MNAVTEVMDELRKALAELEDCRARNADLRTMLEQVTRERDEARADLARSVAAWESAGMQGRTAHDAMLALAKERDEARAEVDRWRNHAAGEPERAAVSMQRWMDITKEQQAEVGRAYRRGAEAMREACAAALMADGLVLSRERAANVVRARPIPEEP